MKRLTLKKKLHRAKLSIQYNFDNLMAKGVVVNIFLIFLITALTVLVLTGLSMLLTRSLGLERETEHSFWTILIHVIDGGTVGNNQSKNTIYLTFMVIVTFLGLLINGALIGTINAAISKKINSLGLSNTKVYEQGHIVIIGFNSLVFTLIEQLLAGMNPKQKNCIVVLSDRPLEEMNEEIHRHFPHTGKTKVICRSGKATDERYLRLCSVSRAKSVIINTEQDFETIKLILSITKYFEKSGEDNPDLHVTAIINEEQNVTTAHIAGGNLVNILHFNEAISRIIAHACRYPGFSKVLKELFSLEGNNVRFGVFPKLEGKTFREILYLFDNAVPIGYEKGNDKERIRLNPDYSSIYEKGDKLIYITKGYSKSTKLSKWVADEAEINEKPDTRKDTPLEERKVLIIGENKLLYAILKEFDKYVSAKSSVTVISTAKQKNIGSVPKLSNIKTYKNLTIDNYTFDALTPFITDDYDTILLLNDLNTDEETADNEIITSLLCINYIMNTKGYHFNIISQLRTTLNQKIADMGFSDFVVGTEITSMISAQVAENKDIQTIFDELLDSKGSELFIRSVADYVQPGKQITLHEIQRVAEKDNQIILGLKTYGSDNESYKIEVNPNRVLPNTFSNKDCLIILAKDNN